MIVIFAAISYLIGCFVIPLTTKLLLESNTIVRNYRNKNIPLGMGIIYVFNIIIVAIIISLLKIGDNTIVYLYLIGILSMGLAGIIDDLIGDEKYSGFKGHIGMLIKGRLTTGGFKAIIGGLISLLISLNLSNSLDILILNLLLITLFTNLINLLDLRPGRAIKFFLLISVILLTLIHKSYTRYILASTSGVSLAYLPYDLKEISMLGDVGANILGVTLGLGAVFLSFKIKIVLIGLLILANLYSEKRSISKLILKNRFLNYIDSIGR